MAGRPVAGLKGPELVKNLKRKFKASTDRDLARAIGVAQPTIVGWNKPTARISGRIVASTIAAAQGAAHKQAIRPIVEFFPITKTHSAQNKRFEVFSVKDGNGSHHSYRKGLRDELQCHSGVYLFFDSRGRALYAGKARSLKLWTEINNAYNRDRDQQEVRRVEHPERKQPYKTSKEMARQIRPATVPLSNLAVYFSAYDVVDTLINEVESLLVRSFPNDLLNVRMEWFGQQQRAKVAARQARRAKKKPRKLAKKGTPGRKPAGKK